MSTISHDPLFPPEVTPPEPGPGASARPPVPVVYENDRGELEQMSLRTYAAIQLRVPESGIAWLDRMIQQSRHLDRNKALTMR